MSLITRCPACGTMFKVVPDQLRISEGWVRCGHCSQVFDASAHLQSESAANTQPATLAEQAPPRREPEPELDSEFVSSLHTEVGDDNGADAPDSAMLEAEAQALLENPLDRPFELRREDPGDAGLAPEPAVPQEHALEPESPEPRSQLEPEPELNDLSFVRQARREAFWRRPVMRVAMVLAIVALALLLASQMAVHDRNRLAAISPQWRPMLNTLCEALDCSIQPPRQIDAIAIDSSSFSKLRGDSFRLNITIRNQAAIDVAMPALELTLTDSQEQPVVRRVLMPAELGANPGVIAAASEWSSSLALAVSANGSRVAGYRLLAFYP